MWKGSQLWMRPSLGSQGPNLTDTSIFLSCCLLRSLAWLQKQREGPGGSPKCIEAGPEPEEKPPRLSTFEPGRTQTYPLTVCSLGL